MTDALNPRSRPPTTLAEALDTIQHLEHAVVARQRVGEALGIVMERYKLDREAAFAYLVRTSSQTNTKLRDVATELVADTVARTTTE